MAPKEDPFKDYNPLDKRSLALFSREELLKLHKKMRNRALGFLAVGVTSGALFVTHEVRNHNSRDFTGAAEIAFSFAGLVVGAMDAGLSIQVKNEAKNRKN